ncbi:hypothetical protein P4482_03985 [Neobacillus thermocopriae]|uniref:hypothetical protein n=1 Tax=Neobacillus thermocopriae TaxID=1215031 RepID=UPI002E2507A5|nr:hypothetical protein [Neobacillus thermocopriae]MED3713371.1 hypothetical protein [Neobacillus thermocopriae]
MDRKQERTNQVNVDFTEIVKKAYEKGVNETEMTVEKLLEDLKTDLKQIVIS